MKYILPQEWVAQVNQDYPHVVKLQDHMLVPAIQHDIIRWLIQHVGAPYQDWMSEHLTYRFKSLSHAVNFSLVFT